MLAPEPFLSACLNVIYRASIYARSLGWAGETTGLSPEQSNQLADLMDAIHNIPHLLQTWETCDQALLRGMLKDYDERWKSDLVVAYEEKLTRLET